MARKQILTLSLTLWGLAALPGASEVIDLGAGTSDLRVQSGVLDFGKSIPARDPQGGDGKGKLTPSTKPSASQKISRSVAGSPVDLAPNSSITLGET